MSSTSSFSSSSTSSSSSSLSPCPDPRIKDLPYQLPPKYKILQIVGQGGFGVVVKCLDLQTREIVAVKISKDRNLRSEAEIMKTLMNRNLDQKNIIKYHGGFGMYKCLEFEILDISLGTYLRRRRAPMRLRNIRAVIQQLAIAFDALKTTGVIHGDVKTTNIMLVDQRKQPFKVKLIDFGLAIYRNQTELVRLNQTPGFRAPEMVMVHPYSEAIDIWALGCVMAYMMFGVPIFPAKSNYELLQYMIDIVGPPPRQLFQSGWKWKIYFNQTMEGQWILKTPMEYWGSVPPDSRRYTFRSLDEVKAMRLEKDNPREADERRECVELLKAMLKWDERERITPCGILNHPFITMSYLNSSSQVSSCEKKEENVQTGEPSSRMEADARIAQSVEETTRRTPIAASSTQERKRLTAKGLIALPSRIIKVRQAPLPNRIKLTETCDNIVSETEEPDNYSGKPALLDDIRNPPDNTEDSKPKEEERKKKKKKNCFKRIYSWMKKKFHCHNEDDVKE